MRNSDQSEAHTPGGGGLIQLVTFELAGEEFGVDIRHVREIDPMPGPGVGVGGVINLRGTVVPVVDLRERFGLPVCARSEHTRIVVVEVRGCVTGFVVDRVHEVLRLDASAVEPAFVTFGGIGREFIAGLGRLEDRLLILLDAPRLFGAGGERASRAA